MAAVGGPSAPTLEGGENMSKPTKTYIYGKREEIEREGFSKQKVHRNEDEASEYAKRSRKKTDRAVSISPMTKRRDK